MFFSERTTLCYFATTRSATCLLIGENDGTVGGSLCDMWNFQSGGYSRGDQDENSEKLTPDDGCEEKNKECDYSTWNPNLSFDRQIREIKKGSDGFVPKSSSRHLMSPISI